MTDHNAAYIVTLAADTREDDAEPILTALRMIKGVLTVTPVPSGIEQHIAQERRDREWVDTLLWLARYGPGGPAATTRQETRSP